MIYNLWCDYNRPMKGEGPFFTDYWANVQSASYPYVGLEYANWDSDRYPYLCEREEILLKRFNERFAYREIGQETAVRFQHFLSMRFDEIAENINHMYSLYANNDVDNIGVGYTDTDTYTGQTKGGSSIDNTGTEATTNNDYTYLDTHDTYENTAHSYGTSSVTDLGSTSITYNSAFTNSGQDVATEVTDDDRKIYKSGDARYKDTPYGDDDAWNNPTNQQVEDSSSYVEGDLTTTVTTAPGTTNTHTGTDATSINDTVTTTPDLYNHNESETYADHDQHYTRDETLTLDTNTTNKYADNKTYTRTIARVENDEHIIEEVNTIAEKYKTIDNIFIDCFEPLFISIVAMI